MEYVVIWGIERQALGILRLLSKDNYFPILVDQEKIGVAKYSRFRKIVMRCPKYYENELLLDFFLNLANRFNLKNVYIFPTDDEQVKFLSINKKALKPYYRIETLNWGKFQKLYYKTHMYKIANGLSIPTPQTILIKTPKDLENKKNIFPAIIKPAAKETFFRFFNKKAIKCNNFIEAKQIVEICLKNKIPLNHLMFQEIIDGPNVQQISTIGAAINGKLESCNFTQMVRQYPIDYGKSDSYVVITDKNETIFRYSELLLSYFPYTGPFCIEFRYDKKTNKCYLLDMNLRFWASHYILKDIVNIPELLLTPKNEVIKPEAVKKKYVM